MLTLNLVSLFIFVWFQEARRLRSLEQKVEELEEQFLCGICMERRRNVAFLCGHGACTLCTQAGELFIN